MVVIVAWGMIQCVKNSWGYCQTIDPEAVGGEQALQTETRFRYIQFIANQKS